MHEKPKDAALKKALDWVSERITPQELRILNEIVKGPTASETLLRIAVEASWPNASKGSLIKAVSHVRDSLREFGLSSDGIKLQHTFAIPDGTPYRIREEINRIPAAGQFWFSHLVTGQPTRIVVGETPREWLPLKWRTRLVELKQILPKRLPGECVLVKGEPFLDPAEFPPPAEDASDETAADEGGVELVQPVPPPVPTEPMAALMSGDPYRVVRLGYVAALLEVYSFFRDWRRDHVGYDDPEVIGCENANQAGPENYVVLGSSEHHGVFGEWNWDRRFNLVLNTGNILLETYASGRQRGTGTALYPRDSFVLVSRSVGDSGRRCITLINGFNPLAVTEVCRLLTNAARVKTELIDRFGDIGERCAFPSDFQIAFLVRLSLDETTVDSISVERFRTLEKQTEEPKNPLRVRA